MHCGRMSTGLPSWRPPSICWLGSPAGSRRLHRIRTRDREHDTPLAWAAVGNRPEPIRLLVRGGWSEVSRFARLVVLALALESPSRNENENEDEDGFLSP